MNRSKFNVDDIDWYLISVARLKKIGAILLLVVLGIGGWVYVSQGKTNPRRRAEAEIASAREALNSLAASKNFNQYRDEFARAQKKVQDANTDFTAGKFPDAETAAIDAQTIAKTALATQPGHDNDAQFLTVEGDVLFQKSATDDWKKADVRAPLFNGDWVKTGDSASAELIFSNGSLYTIGPNALLEIYSVVNPQTSKKQNSVQMQVGSVEVATTDDVSTVRTPGSQIVVDSDSTTQVGVDRTKQATSVVTMKGSSLVAPLSGGPAVKVSTGEQIVATKEGSLSAVKKALMPPGLLSPSDNQVVQLGPNVKIDFAWEPQPGATSYKLQVSRSRLFSALEINAGRPRPSAAARVTAEGTFYWRVASVGPDGEMGPYSQFRRFRVLGGGTGAAGGTDAEKNPPVLQLVKPFQISAQFYIIEGKTDPGATVFINDEEVDVESDGRFKKLITFNKVGSQAVVVKAVSPAGLQTIQTQKVFVDEP
jgi:hypothetical protein